MRAPFSLLVACMVALLTAGGCRTPPLDMPLVDDFGNNTRPADMAKTTTPRDMAVPSMGCAALITCINNCMDPQCQNNCFDDASTSAQQSYDNATQCIYNFCLEPSGKRPARCVQEPDGTFDDPDGGAGVCNTCLENAYAQLGGYDCMPLNDPDCNPAQCNSQVTLCLNN